MQICKFPFILLAIFLTETILLAFAPVDRTVWLSEGLVAWIPAAVLIFLYMRGVRFSNGAYMCMFLWFFLHTIGGHYTFAEVPFDLITEAGGFQRNHFDRICHFLVGAFAYPAVEILENRRLVSNRITGVFLVIMAIFGFAGIFEIVEWLYAVLAAPEAGAAFLGSQGDIWDAQKDILADGLGAILFTALYCVIHKNKKAVKAA